MLNVLKLALPVVNRIASDHTFEYRTFLEDTVTPFGICKATYSGWKTCVGSVQPQDASLFDMDGTEPAKRMITVWAQINLNTTDRQAHPDQVRHNGRVYNVMTCTDWLGPNGWHTFSCSEDKYQSTWSEGGESGGSGDYWSPA